MRKVIINCIFCVCASTVYFDEFRLISREWRLSTFFLLERQNVCKIPLFCNF